MGFLTKIFGDKKEAEAEVINEKISQETYSSDILICTQCEMPIHHGQKVKTFAGKKMHMKPCWFKLRKNAKSFM